MMAGGDAVDHRRRRSARSVSESMMDGYGMMGGFGMWGGGSIWLLTVIVLILAIAALNEYLRQ
jgi:hypothetical protein